MTEARVAFVALGSNLDDPRAQVLRALEELDVTSGIRTVARSSLYRNPAVGAPGQPDFINAVARLETTLDARALLDALLAVERKHGRTRGDERWGPRTLDLDLLLYGDELIDEPGLTVPHPGLTGRAFVLYPLAELAPDLVIPGAGPVHTFMKRVPGDALTVLED